MTIHFSVAIPTYNGASRLPTLLDTLAAQLVPADLVWQIIVVDNNSTDNTKAIVSDYQARWQGSPLSLQYGFEERQGAAFARQKAISLADSDLIGFLDDDVIPANNWVSVAYQFGLEHPQAGAYGGKILGRFEVDPPENFKRIQSFLALRDRGNTPHLYDPPNLVLPPSAAWVVRKKAWLEHVPATPTLGGRAGKSMVQGDDYEPLLYMHKAHWEIWYNPQMSVEHCIPASRLQKPYLIALSQGCGLCVFQLRVITTPSWQIPLVFGKVVLGSLKRTLMHWVQHRQELKDDLVCQCEQAFLLSSLYSPFRYVALQLKS
jgi:Glycosyl transferase family 2